MIGPLHGARVVVLAGIGPTPFASMLLADMGADVVRVARPAARRRAANTPVDDVAAEYDLTNRGVRTVELDLKSPGGLAAGLALVREAEVFIEGFRPGVAERLGLGPAAMLEANPALVYARLTGYGQDGPRAQAVGHDINYVAQSGALHLLGHPGSAPNPPVNLLGDYAGGGAIATIGVLAALLYARQTGTGQVVDCAVVEGVALLTARLQGLRSAGALAGAPGTNYLDGGAPYYATYECSDGRHVAVGALEAPYYRTFVEGLGVDTSSWPSPFDESRWPELRMLIAGVLSTRSRDDWDGHYADTDACVTAVLDFDEGARDVHNSARAVFQRVGDVLHPSPSPRFSLTPSREPEAPGSNALSVDDVLDGWAHESASENARPQPGGIHADQPDAR